MAESDLKLIYSAMNKAQKFKYIEIIMIQI